MRITRALTGGSLVAGMFLAGAFGIVLGGSGGPNPRSIAEARVGEASYVLSDLQIEAAGSAEAGNSAHAVVSYIAKWTTADHPGLVTCQMRLFDVDGGLVGSGETKLVSLEPISSRTEFPGIAVSGDPPQC